MNRCQRKFVHHLHLHLHFFFTFSSRFLPKILNRDFHISKILDFSTARLIYAVVRFHRPEIYYIKMFPCTFLSKLNALETLSLESKIDTYSIATCELLVKIGQCRRALEYSFFLFIFFNKNCYNLVQTVCNIVFFSFSLLCYELFFFCNRANIPKSSGTK